LEVLTARCGYHKRMLVDNLWGSISLK